MTVCIKFVSSLPITERAKNKEIVINAIIFRTSNSEVSLCFMHQHPLTSSKVHTFICNYYHYMGSCQNLSLMLKFAKYKVKQYRLLKVEKLICRTGFYHCPHEVSAYRPFSFRIICNAFASIWAFFSWISALRGIAS